MRSGLVGRHLLKRKGFTIVELLVVILVIGVLTTITLVGFSKFQTQTRDSQRNASVTVIAEALEKYYDMHGEYPSCPSVAATSIDTVTSTTLQNVEHSALIAPNSTDKTVNSIKCSTLTINGTDFYEYSGDGSSTCTSGGSCLSYTLKYKNESDGTIASLNSRHTTQIATSGVSTLSLGTPTFTTVPVSWTAASNAVSYTLERSSSCSDFSAAIPLTTSSTSVTVTNLNQNTFYCFRVAANASNGQTTNYSNTSSATTKILVAPTLSIGSVTANSFVVSWPAVTNAVTYDLEQNTTDSFTGVPTLSGISGTSSSRTGLTTGTTYYLKGRSVATDNGSPIASPWSSASVSATPSVPDPTGVVASWTNNYGSNSQTATCSLGSPQFRRTTTYRTDGSTAESWGSWTSYQTATTFATDFIAEGMYGMVKVQAKCVWSGIDSDVVESAPISMKRPITYISAGTWYNRQTSPALIGVGGVCPGGVSMYKWGQIWHGSAGYHSGGGWGQVSDFQLTNGTPNYSMNDGLNVYRISRTVCQSPYWESSMTSQVPGGTLGACCGGITTYNGFVYAGYNYSVAR